MQFWGRNTSWRWGANDKVTTESWILDSGLCFDSRHRGALKRKEIEMIDRAQVAYSWARRNLGWSPSFCSPHCHETIL